MTKESLKIRLRALTAGMADSLPSELEEFVRIWSVLADSEWDAQSNAQLRTVLGNIKQRVEGDGEQRTLRAARAIEHVLSRVPTEAVGSGISEDTLDELFHLLQELISGCDIPYVQPSDGAADRVADSSDVRRVVVFYKDAQAGEPLADSLRQLGFSAELCIGGTAGGGKGSACVAAAAAVIVENDCLLEDAGIASLIGEFSRKGRGPVIAIAEHDDIATRQLALRLGVSHFLTRPLDISRLIRILGETVGEQSETAARILIVDDDDATAAVYGVILEESGMDVCIINDPREALDAMAEFRPELVLMDLYMPHCDGIELAGVIRQDVRHHGVPIVFLSSERSESKHLEAIRRGGDEFLTKPVEMHDLIAIVQTRVERAREVLSVNKELQTALREKEFQQFALDQHAIVSISDAQGRISYVNDRFCQISGYTRDELLGADYTFLYGDDVTEDRLAELRDSLTSAQVWRGELCLRARDGKNFWVESTVVPNPQSAGVPGRTIAIYTDVTEIKRGEMKIRERQQRLERFHLALTDLAHDADVNDGLLSRSLRTITSRAAQALDVRRVSVWFFDDDLDSLYCSMLYDREQGRHTSGAVLKAEDCPSYFSMLPRSRIILAEDVTQHPYTRELARNYCARYGIASLLSSPVRRRGQIKGAVSFEHVGETRNWHVEDQNFAVSLAELIATVIARADRRRAEQALRESEERLQRSQSFAEVGTWDWNIETGQIFWTPETAGLFGRERSEQEINFDEFVNIVHKDDHDSVAAAIKRCFDEQVPYDVEHKIVWPDGSVHWVHERGNVVRDAAGRAQHMLGMVQDITRRKEAELGQARRQALLDLLRAVMSRFVQEDDPASLFCYVLDGIVELTGSRLGFVGEVFGDAETPSRFEICAISEEGAAYPGKGAKGAEFSLSMFHELDTRYGQTLRAGEPVYVNSPPPEPLAEGFPEGHPRVENFLSVPVFYGKQIVGIYAVANRAEGYNEDMVDFLRPLNSTLGMVINGMRVRIERAETQKAMQDARDAAETANQAKSEFLSRMSHELRTPLNAILGFGQLLMSDSDDPLTAMQEEGVTQILRGGWHLLDLINEVLDLAKIEAGKVALEIETIDINQILEESISLIAPQADQRGIELHIPATRAPCRVRADRKRIKQVLLNLLSNAVKYNSDSGSVHVEYEYLEAERVRIKVSDTGAGLSQDDIDRLFQPFERLSADKGPVEGTGIGLVITKRLMELMHGEVGVESTPGAGATFWVELNVVAGEKSDGEVIGEQTVQDDKRPDMARQFTVLYIEDNAANRKLISTLISRHSDLNLVCAETAEIGLQKAREIIPNLVLMDINLPGMDGFEALRVMRADEALRHIPVVAVTADALNDQQQRGLDAGFEAYVTKPIRVNPFLELLDDLLLKQ